MINFEKSNALLCICMMSFTIVAICGNRKIALNCRHMMLEQIEGCVITGQVDCTWEDIQRFCSNGLVYFSTIESYKHAYDHVNTSESLIMNCKSYNNPLLDAQCCLHAYCEKQRLLIFTPTPEYLHYIDTERKVSDMLNMSMVSSD